MDECGYFVDAYGNFIDEAEYQDELLHYGVLGMKWGVRRNASRAYGSAIKKKNKLEKKAMKLDTKAAKQQSKAAKVSLKATEKLAKATSKGAYQDGMKLQLEANKKNAKAAKLNKKAAKYRKKKQKWEKEMNKAFAGYTVKSLPKQKMDSGKAFVNSITKGRYQYEVTPSKTTNSKGE